MTRFLLHSYSRHIQGGGVGVHFHGSIALTCTGAPGGSGPCSGGSLVARTMRQAREARATPAMTRRATDSDGTRRGRSSPWLSPTRRRQSCKYGDRSQSSKVWSDPSWRASRESTSYTHVICTHQARAAREPGKATPSAHPPPPQPQRNPFCTLTVF